MKFRFIISVLSIFLPFQIKRWVITKLLNYKIHPTARIGFSLIFPKRLEMGPYSYIGHFNVCKGLEFLCMREKSIISNLNWITGVSANSKFFSMDHERRSELFLGKHSAITNRHLIDCTNTVYIGQFTIFSGFRSQILTHSIDLKVSRQSSAPVKIGDYCFVGTNCILLKGASLPSYSILAASSILNRGFAKEYFLYAGVPAGPKKELPKDWKYFTRTEGFVI
jgi:acetyltransferase-like isoleucine patch superfamily enzyme